MSPKDEVIINCVKDLVEHNEGMVEWVAENDVGNHEALSNYYEGKRDAYKNMLAMLRDFNRMEQI